MRYSFTALLVFPLLSIAQTFTATVNQPLLDDGSTQYFNITVSGLPATIDSSFGLETICFNMNHTWNDDVELSIKAPDGTVAYLFSHVGGDQDNFVNTCLNNNAAQSINQGATPFTGTFRPMGQMGIVNNGQNPNGVWQLIYRDTYAWADAGYLFNFSLTFGNNPALAFTFASSNLPIVKIFTENGAGIVNEPKTTAMMRIMDRGEVLRNYVSDTNYTFSHRIGIELRGNSSQGMPKKSYGFETWDMQNMDVDTPLLGMPSESDWILIASYSDKTHLRNALAYELSRRMGRWAPRCRFVELFVNGAYQGLYIMMEKIKRDDQRVEIAKLDSSDVTGDAVTGGYIVKIDWQQGNSSSYVWQSNYSQPNAPSVYTTFQIDYPNTTEVPQRNYIRNFVDSFETALYGADFQHPTLGWRRFATESSCMDYLLLNELAKNVDAYRLSTFFYKEKVTDGNKIKMGPVWDFDLAWMNADYCMGQVDTGWMFRFNYFCGSGVPFWWERLMQDSLFKKHLYCRWHNLRQTVFSQQSLFAYIDSCASFVDEAQQRNFSLWPILGVYVWPNPQPIPFTYAGEIAKLKYWITARLQWMDNALQEFASPLPMVNLGPDTVVCAGATVLLNAGTADEYHWSTGDSTAQISVSNSGTYSVTTENIYGCRESDEVLVSIASPNSGFTWQQVGDLSYVFVPNDPNQTAYLWIFPSEESINAIPAYTFSQPGTYNISLVVADENGCSSTTTLTITITVSSMNEPPATGVVVFPNPVRHEVQVRTADAMQSLRLTDVRGATMQTVSVTSNQEALSTSQLSPGVYVLTVTMHDGKQFNVKLLKE